MNIPRKWLIVGTVVIGCCFLAVLALLAAKAISPGPTKAEREATATAVFATVVQENLATLRAQPGPVLPSSTPLLTPTATSLALATSAPALLLTPSPEAAASLATPPVGVGMSCIPAIAPQTAKVIEVVDGDTINVTLDSDGKTYSVRYIGIDTPEMEPAGIFMAAEAKARNAQLTAGKTVTMVKDVSEVDRYDRLLRYVVADNVFVNYTLVLEGYARAVSYPPDVACIPTLETAQQQASAAKVGLWGRSPTPIALPTAVRSGGSVVTCDCTGPDLDCANFITHAEAQACYETCRSQGYGDVFRLDGNGDGQACETLP